MCYCVAKKDMHYLYESGDEWHAILNNSYLLGEECQIMSGFELAVNTPLLWLNTPLYMQATDSIFCFVCIGFVFHPWKLILL